MNLTLKLAVATLFAVLNGVASAQAPAESSAPGKAQTTATADPVVGARTDVRDAKKIYSDKVAAARKVRDAKVKAAVDVAVKEAKAQGKDVAVAKRDATKKAREAAKPEYDAAVHAAAQERNAGVAEGRKKTRAATASAPTRK